MFKKVATIAALILMIFAAASCGKAAGANVDIYNVDVAQFKSLLMAEKYTIGDVVVVTGTVINTEPGVQPEVITGMGYLVKLESNREILSFFSEVTPISLFNFDESDYGGIRDLKVGQKVSLQVKIMDLRFIVSDLKYSGDTTELGDAKVVKIWD